MKTLVDHLAQYAAYHRDRRNIFSHFIGIPMIVLSIAVLLARPALGFGLSPALLLALAAALFYLRLDLRFGVAMTALLALTVWGAAQLAAGTTAAWLGWGVGLFVVGWIIQFVGHYYEGRKPAFVDDLSGLIVGPLFVLAELAFLLGLRGDVQREVEARREQPAPVSGSQGFEQAPQARKVQASSAGGDSLPVSARDLLAFQRPVSSHAAMALASYNSTASLNIDAGAEDVLGLDLYA